MFGFARHSASSPASADSVGVLPTGVRVATFGDIHGRAELLEERLTALSEHRRRTETPSRDMEIFLGDYVDRGPYSRRVVELLMEGPRDPGVERICIGGNHENMLLDFLDDPTGGALWLRAGGLATLVSYGVTLPDTPWDPAKLPDLSDRFNDVFPDDHRAFLSRLPDRLELGGYWFVHAGIEPGVALTAQRKEVVTWIREPFLSTPDPSPRAVVVHGHTIAETPEFLSHRIGIDTGAWNSGRLTCLILQGRERLVLDPA